MAWFCPLSPKSCKVEQGRARDWGWRLQGMPLANHLREDRVPDFLAISSGRHWAKLFYRHLLLQNKNPCMLNATVQHDG